MVKKTLIYLGMARVVSKKRVDVGELLLGVELHRVGGHGKLKRVQSLDRNDLPVLSSEEGERLRRKASGEGVDGDVYVNRSAVVKLTKAGIMWPEGETRSEFARDIFREHTGADLSRLERDVVRLQAWSFLNGEVYNSTLLPVEKLESVKASCSVSEDGRVDDVEFIAKTIELARSLDDFYDQAGP